MRPPQPTVRTSQYALPSLHREPGSAPRTHLPLALGLCAALLSAACGSDGDGNGAGDTEDTTETSLDGGAQAASGGNGSDSGSSSAADPDAGSASTDETDAGDEDFDGLDPDEDLGSADPFPDASVPLPPVAEGDFDSDEEVPDELNGAAFVEKFKSFQVTYPPVLFDLYSILSDFGLLGDGSTRVFGQLVEDLNDGYGLELRYGSVDVDADSVPLTGDWQDPITEHVVSVAPSADDPLLYVSEPFEYRLSMRIELDLSGLFGLIGLAALAPEPEIHNIGLETTKALWTAKFSPDFQAVEAGTLTSVLPRAEAEAARIPQGGLACDIVCDMPWDCDGSPPESLADFFDCRGTELDSDLDGDGVNDSYQIRIEFEAERVQLPERDLP